MNSGSLKENAFFYLSCALAFALPLLQGLVPPLILLLALSLFVSNQHISQLWIALKQKSSVLLLVFYVLYALGILYTENKAAGWFDLQVKLSILLFPIILFPALSFDEEKIKKLLRFFILGCSFAIIICFCLATFNFLQEKLYISRGWYNLNYGINFFLSARLSYFMHPSYFAMYLCLALAALFFYKQENILPNPKMRYVIASAFIFSIIFLASKAGLIILGISLAAYFIMSRNFKIIAGLSALIIFLFGMLYLLAPEFAGKFTKAASAVNSEETDIKTSESSSARILVWKSALQVIKEQKIWGSGTGDVKDVLLERYALNGYTGLLEKKLNAHNQFLQTAIAIGYPGVALLLGILIYSIYIHAKKRSMIGTAFTIIIIINFLFESMLETQAGVIFFAFFYSLLGLNNTTTNE